MALGDNIIGDDSGGSSSNNIRAYYFPDILRKINIAFESLWKNIQVAKYDSSGTIINYRPVPYSFVHKQKFIATMLKNEDRTYNEYLPRMGVSIKSLSKNTDKNRGGYLTPFYKYIDDQSISRSLFAGVPYKINYTLAIVSLHMSEMSMILEQILPEFNPYKNITIQEFSFLPDFTRDIQVNLENITPGFIDHFDQAAEIPRIEMELDFSMDFWIYRPIPISKIIKTVNIDYIPESVIS